MSCEARAPPPTHAHAVSCEARAIPIMKEGAFVPFMKFGDVFLAVRSWKGHGFVKSHKGDPNKKKHVDCDEMNVIIFEDSSDGGRHIEYV